MWDPWFGGGELGSSLIRVRDFSRGDDTAVPRKG